jgi:hypothetical protein
MMCRVIYYCMYHDAFRTTWRSILKLSSYIDLDSTCGRFHSFCQTVFGHLASLRCVLHDKSISASCTERPNIPCSSYNSNSQSSFTCCITTITNMVKNGVFWVVTPCGSCKNRRFGGTWRLLHQGDKNRCTEIPSISSQRTSVASCSLCCS